MTSPMMQQYRAAKAEHPEGILFFRMGDFFEMFHEDARQASKLLGLTLTSRSKGAKAVPMAGVPVRAAESYINRLVRQGYKVVLCDQVEDPSKTKGLVRREVTRVVTPGTVLAEEGLEEKEHNFLCGLFVQGEQAGLAVADLSTGTFLVEEVGLDELPAALARRQPAECLVPESALEAKGPYQAALDGVPAPASTLPDWRFDREEAQRLLCQHFRVAALDGFGVGDMRPGIAAAGATLLYLRETQRGAVAHLTGIRRLCQADHLVLDTTSHASLETLTTRGEGGREGSLLGVLDRTLTPMGARLLKSWILEPLARLKPILQRQEGVRELLEEESFRTRLRDDLTRVQDVERLVARIACGRAGARELVGLRASLKVLPSIRAECAQAWAPLLGELPERLPHLEDLVDLLDRALLDKVPLAVREGGLIREGFDPELDQLRALSKDHRAWVAAFQKEEQERTGIPSLKVGFNRVFGYYIEITHPHRELVPKHYIRKQTIKNAERYITPELKHYEEQILSAEERSCEMEYLHFLKLREAVQGRLPEIQRAAEQLALLDVLQSLAEVAGEQRYVRPELDESRNLELVEGRHPVLDITLKGEPFVPNDLDLKQGARELLLITGPNMAGKSTYIRQTALIVIMAQMGSFVPAESARLGLVDRIFTRVGASDELSKGNSTFMTEMIETAAILNGASERSLVILDEVGRGTSTFDGLSIAWAITEHLADKVHCRTLFATHYHQLADLVERLPNACNMNVAVREWGDDIVFLHKIIEGSSDRSYGIHVARLAGLPASVLERAREVLLDMEQEPPEAAVFTPPAEKQLVLFPDRQDPLRLLLEDLEIDGTTPREALQILYRLRDLMSGPK